MSTEGLTVVLASWPDEDHLVAEIWSGDTYVGDVRQRPAGFVAVFAPGANATPEVSLSCLIDALKEAGVKLSARGQ